MFFFARYGNGMRSVSGRLSVSPKRDRRTPAASGRRPAQAWNTEGRIKIAEIHDNNIGRNADELLRKVEAAQFVASHDGEVCPAKWKKGEATLKPSIDLVGKI